MSIFTFIIFLFISIVAKAEDNDLKSIVIDCGHGGIDGGASINGIKESEINLKIGFKLKSRFESAGYTVIMTRTTDDDVCEGYVYHKKDDLKGRTNIINRSGALFYLSIHLNMFSSEKVKGFQVIYNKSDEKSLFLSNSIYQSFAYYIGGSKRGVVADETLYVLSHAALPGCLIECGFLSNPEERELLISKEYQYKLSEAIYYGSVNYLSM